MPQIAPGIEMVDTRLGGWEGITAVYLVAGERPALVDAGAQTTAENVRDALAAQGVGPDDLAWIVLTHIHLDHCGATGLLARWFPKATVVVHRRGARHLAEPDRLVTASAEVYGADAPLYGGLDPTDPERIVVAEDGHRVDLGGGRALRVIETLGHARHHTSILDEATGTVLAGDAVGVRLMGRGGLMPTLPPPDIDVARYDRSLERLAALGPERLCLAHFGPVDDPAATLVQSSELLRRSAEAGCAGVAGGADGVWEELERRLPQDGAIGDPEALALYRRLGWGRHNATGLALWAENLGPCDNNLPGGLLSG